jgi:glycosyltransferase involved in cell wall biosynthesis
MVPWFNADGAPRKDPDVKILYIVNEDWFFVSHFLGIARAARDAGHQIHVAARVGRDGAAIRAEGFALHPITQDRGRASPLRALATVMRLRRLIRAERPDLVHTLSTQSTLLGGLAARLAAAPALALSPTGLGHFWTEPGLASVLGRQVTRGLLRVIRAAPALVVFFENRDDPPELGFDAADGRIVMLGGAGVDPAAFPPQPPPQAPPVRFAVVARMLRSKGVSEAVEAVALARSHGLDATLDLWGSPDPDNRNTFAEGDLQAWSRRDGIRWRGPTSDVAGVWRDSHVALLLSYREGLPRSLVEAAASARPIITTDVPGCRAVVDDGVEGLLAPPRDVEAAARAIERLARDADLRARMGAAARRRFEAEFAIDRVAAKVLAAYARLQSARVAR